MCVYNPNRAKPLALHYACSVVTIRGSDGGRWRGKGEGTARRGGRGGGHTGLLLASALLSSPEEMLRRRVAGTNSVGEACMRVVALMAAHVWSARARRVSYP